MEDDLSGSITGFINLTETHDTNGVSTITASWERGNVVGVSKAFLTDKNRHFIEREGDIITVCQFRLQVIGENKDMCLAQRIDA